jgi:acetyl-CoA carboxylase biotin carboxylase subunit
LAGVRKILIANRGEIAVRVIRACRDMGLGSVAVYSDCDRAARHVRMADEAVHVGGNPPAESYLHIDRLIGAAHASGADAVHPGYGFLAESERFARRCQDAGLTFVGPPPEVLAAMGSKTAARRVASRAGVPVVPGTDDLFEPEALDQTIAAAASQIGYPLLIKAVAGGGGRGMRMVAAPDELPSAIRAARSEAQSSFADARVYLERRLMRPRHVEVQVLADRHGTVQPFVERECSIQRRHQKVVEESPSPAVSPALRARLLEAAVAVVSAAGYVNAGTVEFLLDEDGRFYFLEVNARLQVEHPVTEMVTGIDLVQWQIRIARGERLALSSADARTPSGHAIECRVYAEDPDLGFIPSPGRVVAVRTPAGPGIRDDGWVEEGIDVPVFYDPLLSKLIAWGEDRDQATARMRRALDEYEFVGIRTSLSFSRWLLAQPAFSQARFHTAFLEELLQQRSGAPFDAADLSQEEVAALVVSVMEAQARRPGMAASARPAAPQSRSRARSWKQQGRLEGLRE